MNTKPVVVLDLDDTLINTREEIYNCLKRRLGRHAVTHWSNSTTFKIEEDSNISIDELIKYTKEDMIFRNIQPHPHSAYFTKDLMDRGYHVVILTAREGFVPNPYDETERYLNRHGIEHDELIIGGHGKNKVDYLEKFDRISFTIDDQIYNCVDFEKSGKVDYVFLNALPQNKSCVRFPRLHSLYQAYRYIGIS